MSIAENVARIKADIASAAIAAGRDPKEIRLCAATKMNDANAVRQAIAAGVDCCGENRVQELTQKLSENAYEGAPVHFIGHLQTNKVRQILPFVHLIHSVDSLRLLECINREAEKIGRTVRVLLEVHVAKEETKSGFTPEELLSLDLPLSTLNHVEICGIMGMATNTDDQQEIRRCFREIKNLAHSLPIEQPIISMGMSDDYLLAIQEGSTMLRIGSSIFGERHY